MKDKIINGAVRENVLEYAINRFKTFAEYPWMSLPNYAVLRCADNIKWYAIIMDIPKNKLGLQGDERIDVLNIKCTPTIRGILLSKKGFLPAYHLKRENWISILLDGSVDKNLVFSLIDESYEIVKAKLKREVRKDPKSWIVPVNPKYYDIQKAFVENDIILWKQSNSIIVGDTIYLYLTAPYSCILYKCVAIEVDIPYEYDDGKVHMTKVMKIKRLYTFDKDKFGLAELREHGVITIRGARSIPYGLLYKLEKESENSY